MINELKIKCFMCLAETLSFTAAGKRLFISQQAVSRHIADLEQDLGIRMFERSRNSVELTEAGVRFYKFSRDMRSQFQRLMAELAGEYAVQTKNIHIGYQNWLEFGSALGSAMAVLRESTPDLHLLGERHSPIALMSLLESAKLDMILILERFIPANRKLRKLLLIKTPMQVVISCRDPLCSGYKGDYHIFESRPLLFDAFEGENQTATVLRARAELVPYNFKPKEIIVLPNRDSIYTEAELNRGIFLSSSTSQTIQNGALARFDTDVLEGLFCVWRAGSSTFYIEKYARQLKREYGLLTERFIKTRRWE